MHIGKNMIGNRSKKGYLSLILATLILSLGLFSGCAKGEADGGELAEIPDVSVFDEGMSKAHFISAPSSFYTASDIEGSELWDNEYTLSYDVTMGDTAVSFLLSDGMGQYGQITMCTLKKSADEGLSFGVQTMANGRIADDGQWVSIENGNSSEDALVEDGDAKDESSGEANDGADEDSALGSYHVCVEVAGGKLTAMVNSARASDATDASEMTFEIPDMKLGSIGVYRNRGALLSYIDNIDVALTNGENVYHEDFEGDKNIFDPYYTKVADGALEVDYGVLLTRLEGAPAPSFSREFSADAKKVKKAYLYMTALGAFDAKINGTSVCDNFLEPGRLNYLDHLNYAAYDVTSLIGSENDIEISLYHGFFDRGVGYPEISEPFGNTLALKGELVIEYKNGEVKIIPTDDSFIVTNDSPVRFDDIYQGEIIDGRYFKHSDKTSCDLAENSLGNAYEDNASEVNGSGDDVLEVLNSVKCLSVDVDAVDEKFLTMPILPKETKPIRSVLDMNPVSVDEPVEGVFVYDFGQNFAGNVSVDLAKCAKVVLAESNESIALTDSSNVDTVLSPSYGEKVITFRYGEALNTAELLNRDDEIGTIFTANLLTAKATDYYICNPDALGKDSLMDTSDMSGNNSQAGEADVTEINFAHSYHGFRYLQITGIKEALPLEAITAHVLSTAMENRGTFTSSDAAINRYYENSRFSILSNFLDTPSDCAQRDERLGWAGDARGSAPFAMYLMDTDKFYGKYIRDLISRQSDDGSLPDIAPQKSGGMGNNCWGDAGISIAYELYLQYGDVDVISENFNSFKRWVDYLEATSDNYIRYSQSYGDHLSGQTTPPELTDTAWCAHSADLVSRMANILGQDEDARHYADVYASFKKAWQDKYIRSDASLEAGILTDESETAYALGIAFELFDNDMLQAAADRLNILVEYSGYVFYPGYSGMGYFLPSLARYGHADTAMKVLTQIAPGSPLYTVALGLTTTPETLNAMKLNEDGTYEINYSLNHHVYAGISAYFYSDILGIRPTEDSPGYEHFIVSPAIDGSLESASGTLNTSFGEISVGWSIVGGNSLNIIVPEGTTCTLILPDGRNEELSDGEYSYSW